LRCGGGWAWARRRRGGRKRPWTHLSASLVVSGFFLFLFGLTNELLNLEGMAVLLLSFVFLKNQKKKITHTVETKKIYTYT
jgi:hypothetical protein